MLKFSAGFVVGFAALFVLILIFGDYEDKPRVSAPPVASVNADTVLSAFGSAGIQVKNVDRNPQIEQDSPLPRSFREHTAWRDALLDNKGGQLFVCDTRELCASIAAYFQMLTGLAGPYIYTSPSGVVVIQLNSSFTPDQAARYKTVLDRF